MKNEQPETLVVEQVMALRKAIIRLGQLRAQAIATADRDTEIAALSRFVEEQLVLHASEFVGTWIVAHNEYIPMCRAWASFNARCAQMVRPPAPAPEADPATPPTNEQA